MENASDFANRLRKNLRKLKTFIKRGDTNAYRIYDADIPEYAVAVDCYGDWLHVQEYAPPKSISPEIAEQRLQAVLAELNEVMAIPPEQIALKQRRQQKGYDQYERQDALEAWHEVYEHGATFQVNLTDYLDTGLFLDHRPIRYWLQQQAKGKRVLNLFCYTATASVHAAIGGAAHVTSVDMSATYLHWGKENFLLNELNPQQHAFIQADVIAWLKRCREQYDIIFLDPPTFSNSKRMRDHFDVQRDHIDLIHTCMRRLNQGGTLMFSNNFRKFKLDTSLGVDYHVQDYQRPSIPVDFERNQRIHWCWFIQHR